MGTPVVLADAAILDMPAAMRSFGRSLSRPQAGHLRDDISKKRPHCWGHNSKEAIGRQSGIVVEGAAFAEKAAWVEDSAIPKEEDRTHIACGLFS
jgi:hypothetical protein